jgi:hypothetical protein
MPTVWRGLTIICPPAAPATHSEAVCSALIALALQKPQSLGYAFALRML